MEPFFRHILERTGRGERVVAALVVGSRGSTPQRIGARMLFFEDGSSWGTVGGGCVESDVRANARRTLADGRARNIEIDLVDDVRGEGDVCGGTLDVLIEPWEASAAAAA
ncbi:MAG: XdhC family protein [Chloroflexi bacterium]|nr:XdhC family protein [Chloroflexota bacterium]